MAEFIGLEAEQKKKVLEGLDRLRPEERVEVLSQALIDDNLQIRLQAVDRAERLELSMLYSGLMWSARQPKGGLRSAVVSCFSSLPAAEFRKIVIRELGSVLTDLRLFALDLLGERGEACDLPNLIPLLGDHKIDVREKARRTLTRIFSRELSQRRERQERGESPAGRHSEEENFAIAVRWLFLLAEGPDQITALAAAENLIDYGCQYPSDFWGRFGRMHLKGREILARLFLKREDAQIVGLLFAGLLSEDLKISDKCFALLSKLFQRLGPAAFLEVLRDFDDAKQARAARLLASGDMLRELVQRFDVIPQNLRNVVFDLLEHVDYRNFSGFLETCLKRQEPQLVYRALQLLIPLGQKNYTSMFLPLLKGQDPEVLLLILDYIQKNGDISNIPALSPLLTHEDERVTRSAVASVFSLSRQHLLGRYQDLSPQARRGIIQLLSRLDSSFIDSLCGDISRLSSMEKIHLVNILEILGQNSKIHATLLKLSKESDQRIRATVAKALQVFSEARQRIELTQAFLQDDDARVRANVIETLDNVEDQAIFDRLTGLTRSPNGRERANAIKKLLDLGYRDFEVSLIQMVEEPDEWTRASAAWVLGEIEAPHLMHLVEERMKDPSAVVRENALMALGKRGTTEQIRGLTEFLEDPDQRVREAARAVMRKRLKLSYEIS